MNRKFLLAILSLTVMTLAVAALETSTFFFEKEQKIWETDQDFWLEKFPNSLRPGDNLNNKLNYHAKSHNGNLTFFEVPIQEMNLNFVDRKLVKVELYLLSRGEWAQITYRQFEQLFRSYAAKLNKLADISRTPKSESITVGASRLEAAEWQINNDIYAQLRWSRAGENLEFLSCFIAPVSNRNEGAKIGIGTALRLGDLKDKVQREGDEVFLDIPMVNQGFKSYCVAATVERVMLFYQANIDQHILAQIFEADELWGTNYEKLISEMNRVAGRINVNFRKVYEFRAFRNFHELNGFVNIYNGVASSKKKPRLVVNNYMNSNQTIIYTGQLFKDMDRECYNATAIRQRGNHTNFRRNIRDYIDQGVPLCWVVRGIDPEFGYISHLRIINGYNEATKSIIYTDSWGAGHEKKLMSADDAFAMTECLFVLTPKK